MLMAAAATYLSPPLASSSTSSSFFIAKKHSSFSISLNKWNHQLGIPKFSTWNGLSHLGLSTSRYVVQIGKKGKCKGKGVYASLFGVGAPEALVIGVVALLVFGPKGLAEAARNLGQTLRTFQPTIRELQDVSQEFKSTLEREIGLDEIKRDIARPTPQYFEDSKKTIDPVEDSQKTIDPVEDSPSSSETSNKEQVVTENLVESKDEKQGTSNEEIQEYLKKLGEEVDVVMAEKQKKAASIAEVKSQVADAEEAASVTPSFQKPESET